MMNRILIAVDDSRPAEIAVSLGSELAQKIGASILLLHVVPIPVPIALPEADSGLLEWPVRLELGKELVRKLRTLLPEKLSVEERVSEGQAAAEVVRIAREWGADLIVVGTHGRRGVTRFIIGSTAESIVRHAECPVLVAHENQNHPENAPSVRATSIA